VGPHLHVGLKLGHQAVKFVARQVERRELAPQRVALDLPQPPRHGSHVHHKGLVGLPALAEEREQLVGEARRPPKVDGKRGPRLARKGSRVGRLEGEAFSQRSTTTANRQGEIEYELSVTGVALLACIIHEPVAAADILLHVGSKGVDALVARQVKGGELARRPTQGFHGGAAELLIPASHNNAPKGPAVAQLLRDAESDTLRYMWDQKPEVK